MNNKRSISEINFDPYDYEGINKLIEEYGKSPDAMFYGTNLDGEDVLISICENEIVVVTYQKNHWVRKNIYPRYDPQKEYYTEELFEGKWGLGYGVE